MNRDISKLFSALSYVAAKYYKKRLIMTSGDRTVAHNKEVGGQPNSYHLIGEAFDAQLVPKNSRQQAELGEIAERLGFRWGGNFNDVDPVHFDNGRRVASSRIAS